MAVAGFAAGTQVKVGTFRTLEAHLAAQDAAATTIAENVARALPEIEALCLFHATLHMTHLAFFFAFIFIIVLMLVVFMLVVLMLVVFMLVVVVGLAMELAMKLAIEATKVLAVIKRRELLFLSEGLKLRMANQQLSFRLLQLLQTLSQTSGLGRSFGDLGLDALLTPADDLQAAARAIQALWLRSGCWQRWCFSDHFQSQHCSSVEAHCFGQCLVGGDGHSVACGVAMNDTHWRFACQLQSLLDLSNQLFVADGLAHLESAEFAFVFDFENSC